MTAQFDIDLKKSKEFAEETDVNVADAEYIVLNCDYIFLGVKPQMLKSLFEKIAPVIEERTTDFTLVSMAAGVSLSSLGAMAQTDCPIIRIMPNMPASVGEGMILYTANEFVSKEDIDGFIDTMKYAGLLDKIDEDKIDEIISAHGETVTALKDEIEKAKQGAEDSAAIAKERDSYKQRVEALEKASGDAAKVQAEYDAYKKQIETEKANAGKKALVRQALEKAGANSAAIDLLLGTVDLSTVEVENDTLKNADAVLKPLRDTHAGLFGTINNRGTDKLNPPNGGGSSTMTRDEIMKIKDAGERQKAIAENIEVFQKGE